MSEQHAEEQQQMKEKGGKGMGNRGTKTEEEVVGEQRQDCLEVLLWK